MNRLYVVSAVCAILCIGLGFYDGRVSVTAQDKQNPVIPTINNIKNSEWQSAIQNIKQFAVRNQTVAEPDEKQNDKIDELLASDIKNAKLVGIFIDQDTSAIIISGKAPAANAKRYRIDDRFDQSWQLISIDNTSITWLNERDNATHTMRLFDSTTPKN